MKLQVASYRERARAHIRVKLKRKIRKAGIDIPNETETKVLEQIAKTLEEK